MSRWFGPIRQLGYVTRDAHASMRLFVESSGIGPWYYFESMMDIECDGVVSQADVLIAFANSGGLQIELIEQRNDAPTAFAQAAAGIEGLHVAHHHAYWPQDYDRAVEAATGAGLRVLQTIQVPRGRVAYWQGANPADLIVEIAESTEGRQRTRDMVAAAAREWDGSDPYRKLG